MASPYSGAGALMIRNMIFAAAAEAAPPAGYTLFASATSTGSTVTWPASLLAGDVAVMLDRATNSGFGIPSSVTPSGFASISDITGGPSAGDAVRQILSQKLCAGSESGALTGMNGNNENAKVLLIFRSSSPPSGVTVNSLNAQETGGNPASQLCTSGSGTPPLIVVAAYGATGAISSRSFSPAKDNEITPSPNVYLAYKIYDAAPSNVSIDMADDGDFNALQSFYLTFS